MTSMTLVVAGNKVTLQQAQVQGLVDIYDIAITVEEKVRIADAVDLPLNALPSFLQVRLKGYYPKTSITNELGMAKRLELYFKRTQEHTRDIMKYGPKNAYTAYCVKQVSEYVYGGDSVTTLEAITVEAFPEEDI